MKGEKVIKTFEGFTPEDFEFPSIGIEIFLSKGLEVKARKIRNPMFNKPRIERKLFLNLPSSDLLYLLARYIQKLKIKHHNNIEPSCPAHVAEIL